MFIDCTGLNEIMFPILYTNILYNTSFMLSECTKLASINLKGLYSGSIKDIIFMFENCISLEYLKINNLDTKDLVNFTNIFDGIKNRINVNNISNITHPELENEIKKISK